MNAPAYTRGNSDCKRACAPCPRVRDTVTCPRVRDTLRVWARADILKIGVGKIGIRDSDSERGVVLGVLGYHL